MAEGFIKLYKKMLDWEWYDDPNTCRVFIHILLKASWKESKWHGVTIKPGQLITSLPSLAEETKLSVHQVRVALDHLTSTGEVADKGQSKYRIITVLKWDEYQGDGRQVADNWQTDGRQVAASKEYKNKKNIRNKYIRTSKKSKTDYDQLAEELKE